MFRRSLHQDKAKDSKARPSLAQRLVVCRLVSRHAVYTRCGRCLVSWVATHERGLLPYIEHPCVATS